MLPKDWFRVVAATRGIDDRVYEVVDGDHLQENEDKSAKIFHIKDDIWRRHYLEACIEKLDHAVGANISCPSRH